MEAGPGRRTGAVHPPRHRRRRASAIRPGFRLEDCATQRNLSDEGRAEAKSARRSAARAPSARSARSCRAPGAAARRPRGSPSRARQRPGRRSATCSAGAKPPTRRCARCAAASAATAEKATWCSISHGSTARRSPAFRRSKPRSSCYPARRREIPRRRPIAPPRAPAPGDARRAAPRPVPSAIWWRQLVPSATTIACGALRTAGKQAQPRPSSSKPRSARPRSRSCPPCRSSSISIVSTFSPGTSRAPARPPASRRTPSGGSGRAAAPSARQRLELQLERPASLARGIPRTASALLASAPGAGKHDRELVAQREQAGRLQADDGDAALDIRRQRVEHALRFALRLVDQPGREERAAAAQRPPDGAACTR